MVKVGDMVLIDRHNGPILCCVVDLSVTQVCVHGQSLIGDRVWFDRKRILEVRQEGR